MAPLVNNTSIIHTGIVLSVPTITCTSDDDNLSVASSLSLSNTSHHARFGPLTSLSNHSSSHHGRKNRNNNGSRRSRRTVIFNPTVTVHNGPAVLHMADYTTQECLNCWYSSEDMQRIRSENSIIVEWMDDHGENVGNDFPHTRGLEAKAMVGRRERRVRRFDAEIAVLNEQRMQKMEGVGGNSYSNSNSSSCDMSSEDDGFAGDYSSAAVHIAMVYADESFPHQVEAYQRAIQDMKEARQVYGLPPLSNAELTTALEAAPTKFNFLEHERTYGSSPRTTARKGIRPSSQDRAAEYDFNDDDTIGTMITVPAGKAKTPSFPGKKLRERFSTFLPLKSSIAMGSNAKVGGSATHRE